MAITATNLAAAHDTTNRTSTAYTTASISFVAGRVYMLAVRGRVASGTPEVGSVTGGGNTWQLLQASNISNITLWLYYCVAGSTTSGTIDITPDGITTWTQAGWIVDEFVAYDVAQSAANSNPSSHSSLTVTLSGFENPTDNVAYGAFAHNEDTALTAGSGFADLGASAEASENANRIKSIWKTGEDTGVDITSATTTADVFGVAAEIMENAPAYPSVQDVTETIVSTASTTHNINMPASVSSGQLLLVLICYQGASSVTYDTPSGWTEVRRQSYTSGGTLTFGLFAKTASGSEGGTSVNFSTSSSIRATAQVFRVSGWDGTVSTGVASAAAGNGLSATSANPPNLAPGWGSVDILWIASHARQQSYTASGAPTDYGNLLNTNPGVNEPSITSARRERNASSEDPDTFSGTSNTSYLAFTIGIRPASVVAADLVLSASAGASNSTLALSAPASLALSASDAVSGATAGVRSPALFTIASDGVSAATMGLRSPALLAMQSDGASDAALGVRSPALLSLASGGISTAAGEVTSPGGILVLSASAGLSNATATVQSPIFLVPSASAGASEATLLLRSPALFALSSAGASEALAEIESAGVAFLSLSQSDGVSSAVGAITVPAEIAIVSAGTGSASVIVSTTGYLIPVTIEGVGSASLAVISPALLAMESDGVSAAAVDIWASSLVVPAATAGESSAAATVTSPALLSLAADGVSTAAMAVRSPALLSLTSAGLSNATMALASPARLALSAVAGVATVILTEITLGPTTKARIGAGISRNPAIFGGVLVRPTSISAGIARRVSIQGGY